MNPAPCSLAGTTSGIDSPPSSRGCKALWRNTASYTGRIAPAPLAGTAMGEGWATATAALAGGEEVVTMTPGDAGRAGGSKRCGSVADQFFRGALVHGHAVGRDDPQLLRHGGEVLPRDAVDVGLAGEAARVVVLETHVAQLSGVRGFAADREVELVGTPQGVAAGHQRVRRLAQAGAVIGDGGVQVGNGQGDVEAFHGKPRDVGTSHSGRRRSAGRPAGIQPAFFSGSTTVFGALGCSHGICARSFAPT